MLNTGTEALGRPLRKKLFAYLLMVICVSTSVALEPKQIIESPRSEVERTLPASPAMAYYLYAGRLFKEGDKEDALFWYYVGELRYRFYLAANPKQSPDGAPALFESLHESVGSVVADRSQITPAMSAKELQRALDWDAANDNGATSKALHVKEWREIRAEFAEQVEVANRSTARP